MKRRYPPTPENIERARLVLYIHREGRWPNQLVHQSAVGKVLKVGRKYVHVERVVYKEMGMKTARRRVEPHDIVAVLSMRRAKA